MKKTKRPGDNISLKTKKSEDPAVMQWINAQTNLMDSLRYLIEHEIVRSGVRNLQAYIPMERNTLGGMAGPDGAPPPDGGSAARMPGGGYIGAAGGDPARSPLSLAARDETAAGLAPAAPAEGGAHAAAGSAGGEGAAARPPAAAGADSPGQQPDPAAGADDREDDDIDDDDIESWI